MKAREMVKGKEEIWINNVLKEVKDQQETDNEQEKRN